MPEGRVPISSARLTAGDVARHSFAIVRRGFDVDEVKTYLQTVARSIELLEQREEELRAAVAEADERAAHPVVDEATLSASLGQHSAQILRHAHDEAAKIVVQAQEGASTLLREAQSRANEIQEQSEGASAERVAEAELMVANARQEALTEVERIRLDAVADGDAVIARAKEEGRALLEQVQEARRRLMADLGGRRRALSIQIEQLRAARDEMAASIQGTRATVDEILARLERSDDDARSAAAAAGDQARVQLPRDVPHDQEADSDGIDGGLGVGDPSPEAHGETTAAARRPRSTNCSPGSGPPPTILAGLRWPHRGRRPGRGGDAGDHGQSATAIVIEVEEETEPEIDEEVEAEGPDAALIARRDSLLSPISAQLSSHIKRALGDDQNRLLDVLRSSPNLAGEALLGPEDLHLSTFITAAQGHLSDAFAAGTVFGGGDEGAPSSNGAVASNGAVDQAAAGLSRTVVTMLRRRIGDGAEDGEEVADRVGSAFREWRGERIERLVGDFAVQAFSAGVAASSAPDGMVRWVMTSPTGCSDCDDNALAGAVPLADGFPTGHAYPPAHSGCRCLVAPVEH